MTRGLEITLSKRFAEIIRVFTETFGDSYEKYRSPEDDFSRSLHAYAAVIESNREAIFRLAAKEINRYLHTYKVAVNKNADEFKIIYFIGRAVEKHLIYAGYIEIARVHMFSLIGLLDYRLESLKIDKPQLTMAMTNLIRLGIFDEELGLCGCYLTYKCVATTMTKPNGSPKPQI